MSPQPTTHQQARNASCYSPVLRPRVTSAVRDVRRGVIPHEILSGDAGPSCWIRPHASRTHAKESWVNKMSCAAFVKATGDARYGTNNAVCRAPSSPTVRR